MTTEIISKYFPQLPQNTAEKLASLKSLYADWNEKINVISRKDMDHFYERHVLHSLAIAHYVHFQNGNRVLDIGTGGGFPGIPLAIFFPETEFYLVDSIGKKILVVNDLIEQLGLKNVQALNVRCESLKTKYDFVCNRAVAPVDDLLRWTQKLIHQTHKNKLPNGILCLKGGDLKEELKKHKKYSVVYPIKEFFKEEFFDTKSVVYIQV
jgi:16S rRNA (guanine527-N7)-methyltransferase